MRWSPRLALVGAASLLALAGCGSVGSSSPMAALRQEFGGSEISRVYPFRANLAHGSYLYFLQLKGPVASPTAAIVLHENGGWSVWEFTTIEVLSGCTQPLSVEEAPVGTPLPPVAAPTVIAGRIEGSGTVAHLTYSVGTNTYPATLLPDGFWYSVTDGKGGRTRIQVTNGAGTPIPFCSG
jgi:hypothetical protein